jgi:8-oxo-dGTP pyrophosphatase MutT (NUDIX family)
MSSASDPTKPARWEKLGETLVAPTRIFDLCAIRYRHPVRRTERDFYVINTRDWVNVVALTTDEQLVLVNQFRFGIDAFSWEIPGGIIDPGEDPLAAGVRELAEETGFSGGGARLLGSISPNPAILNNRCHFICVDQCTRVSALAWDADEEIEVKTTPVEEALALARAGGIQHSLTMNALFLFEPQWRAAKRG